MLFESGGCVTAVGRLVGRAVEGRVDGRIETGEVADEGARVTGAKGPIDGQQSFGSSPWKPHKDLRSMAKSRVRRNDAHRVIGMHVPLVPV